MLLTVALLFHKSTFLSSLNWENQIRISSFSHIYLGERPFPNNTILCFILYPLTHEFLWLLRYFLNHFSDLTGTNIRWLSVEQSDWSHWFLVIQCNLVYMKHIPDPYSVRRGSTHNDTLQLYCMELFDYMCSGHDDQLLVQIYNITHCPIYWLQLAMYQCDHLLKVVHSKADKVSWPTLTFMCSVNYLQSGEINKMMFNQLRKMLANVFNPLQWVVLPLLHGQFHHTQILWTVVFSFTIRTTIRCHAYVWIMWLFY